MQINKDYICNSSNYRKNRRDKIKYIVIHYVGASGTAKQNALYYHNNSGIGASAHYYVGHASENGAIYQSVPESACAWHCGSETGKYYHACRNDSSIGIEMCCHKGVADNWYFDEITVTNAIALTKELMAKYNIPAENVIRHYDVTHKCCPAPFVKNPALWENFKKELISVKELTTANDIVYELYARGIISDRDLWLKKLNEDTNDYWLARKIVKYLREKRV